MRRLPLALAQREVLLDQRAFPDSPHLLLGGAALLQGEVDDALLLAGLRALQREQAALRLRALDHLGQTLLDPDEAADPPLHEATPRWPEDPWASLQAAWEDLRALPPALRHDVPWRMTRLRLGPQLQGWLLSAHHAVMDGWGSAQFMRRWSEWVQALARGEQPAAQDGEAVLRAIQDGERYLASPACAADAAYWQQLHRPLAPAPYPLTRAPERPGLGTGVLARQPWARARLQRWQDCAQAQGQTAFAVVLAALALHTARTQGVQDLVIGVPALNRPGAAHKTAVGMYVGVLPLRLRLAGQETARGLLQQIATQLHAGLRHARYPASALARDLGLLAAGRDSLFDLLLSFERQDYSLPFGGATLSASRQQFSGCARYPLSISVCDFGPERDPEAVAEGDAARFDARALALLLRRVAHLADALCAAPEQLLAALPLLDAEERAAVLEGPHREVQQLAEVQPFVQRFAAQARLLPQASALCWDGGALRYGELAGRVQALADRLQAAGVQPGDVVALALPRGPDHVQALLACAWVGALFLPLDLEAPAARRAALQAAAEVRLGLCAAEGETLPGVAWLRVDAQSTPPRSPLAQNAAAGAYLLFTSGSSGAPKGVRVSQGALARRLAWMADAWAIGPADRSLQGTQTTFDPALIELLLPLMQGGSVALPPPGRLAPESLAAFAARHGCSFTALVPTTLRRLLDGLEALPARERSRLRLRLACCGGEVLAPALAARWRQVTGGAALWNVYGPTEACIFASAWACRPEDETLPLLPIGRPLHDTRLYVLDAQQQPLPVGSVGELWIGGAALAEGYLGDAARTAEAFRSDPFGAAGTRIYRSGDLAWWDGEGRLQFAGRADRQLKLRGLRIEPGEIEAALSALPGVAEAHVALVDEGERALLQAWLAPAGLDLSALQARLRASLPEALVPARWLALDALPRSSTGKIDSAALPAHTQALAAREPATALEATLRDLLRDVLQRPQLGVDDDFFAAGGDSLAALDWLTAIEQRTGLRPTLALLASAPSAARLAAVLVREGEPGPLARSPSGRHPLALRLAHSAEGGAAQLFLAASGHGDLLRFQALAQALADAAGTRLNAQMLQPSEQLADPSLDALAQAYAAHIAATLPPGTGCVVAGFSVGGVAALETARALRQRGIPVHQLVLIDCVFPRWLFRQPWLWRLAGALVRRAALHELTMNGRRLGAMFGDAGLLHQVQALRGYRVAPLDAPVTLLRSTGLARWQRWLFGPWKRQLTRQLQVREIAGLHGSMFEPAQLPGLVAALAETLRADD